VIERGVRSRETNSRTDALGRLGGKPEGTRGLLRFRWSSREAARSLSR